MAADAGLHLSGSHFFPTRWRMTYYSCLAVKQKGELRLESLEDHLLNLLFSPHSTLD
jgi:hypothetical protein